MLVRTLKPHFDWLKPNFVCWRDAFFFFVCVCVEGNSLVVDWHPALLGRSPKAAFWISLVSKYPGYSLQLKTMCVCWKPFFARKNKHILWTCWVIAASEAKLWHVVPDTTSFNAAIAALGKSLLWEKDRHIFGKNVGYLNPPNTAKNGKTIYIYVKLFQWWGNIPLYNGYFFMLFFALYHRAVSRRIHGVFFSAFVVNTNPILLTGEVKVLGSSWFGSTTFLMYWGSR